jgi:hypothetical protein
MTKERVPACVQHDSLNVGDHWQVGIEFGYTDENGQKVEGAWQVRAYPLTDGKPHTSAFLYVEGSAETDGPGAADVR